MVGRWVYPLDPECPDVQEFGELADDPMMIDSGCWGEFYEDFSKSHRAECKRCQSYGAANVGVDY